MSYNVYKMDKMEFLLLIFNLHLNIFVNFSVEWGYSSGVEIQPGFTVTGSPTSQSLYGKI